MLPFPNTFHFHRFLTCPPMSLLLLPTKGRSSGGQTVKEERAQKWPRRDGNRTVSGKLCRGIGRGEESKLWNGKGFRKVRRGAREKAVHIKVLLERWVMEDSGMGVRREVMKRNVGETAEEQSVSKSTIGNLAGSGEETVRRKCLREARHRM